MAFRTPTFPWPGYQPDYSDAALLPSLKSIHRLCGGIMIDPSWSDAEINAALDVAVEVNAKVIVRVQPWATDGAYSWISTHDATSDGEGNHLSYNAGVLADFKTLADAAGAQVVGVFGDTEWFGSAHSTGPAWIAARKQKYQSWMDMARGVLGDISFDWYGRQWNVPFANGSDVYTSSGFFSRFSDDDPGDFANVVLYRPGADDERLNLKTIEKSVSSRLEAQRREPTYGHKSIFLYLGQYYTTGGMQYGYWGFSNKTDCQKKMRYWAQLLNTPGTCSRVYFYPGIFLDDNGAWPHRSPLWKEMFSWYAEEADRVSSFTQTAVPQTTNPIVHGAGPMKPMLTPTTPASN